MLQVVISDRGPQFVSKFMKELYRLLEITPNALTTWHPQTDGQTERVNQEVEKYLRIFVNYRQDDWTDWLPLAEFAHNNRVHSATGKSPFMVLYGRNPRLIPDAKNYYSISNPAASNFITTMSDIHRETREALQKAATNMKRQYDKKRTASRDYQVGDKVWLDSTNLHLPRPKKKLDDKHVGPFVILEKAGAAAYKLKLPEHWKIHPRFNKKLLTPYIPPNFPNQEVPPAPPPDLINDEEEFEIEEILDSRPRTIRGGRGKKPYDVIDYFVKWKGWTREHNSWVRDSEMGNAQEAIEEYENKNDSARRLDAPKIITKPTKSPIATILDHEYSDDGKVKYLCQAVDGRQKWKFGPEEYNFYWVKLTKDYWQSQVDSQYDHPEDKMDDGYGGEARGMHEPDFANEETGP